MMVLPSAVLLPRKDRFLSGNHTAAYHLLTTTTLHPPTHPNGVCLFFTVTINHNPQRCLANGGNIIGAAPVRAINPSDTHLWPEKDNDAVQQTIMEAIVNDSLLTHEAPEDRDPFHRISH